ncbi:MAG TPA: TetR/AcrR family transcriptional regulator [Acidimicrobiia bacterium]|jgi:AcrR family transcriptional regulator
MDAALSLFMRQGFQNTSVRQVAECAEVSEQTIYNIFEDKIGLLRDSTAHYVEVQGSDADAGLLDALRSEPNPLKRIRIAARDSRETWESTALELELMVFHANSSDPRLKDLERMGRQYKLEGALAVCELLFPDEVRRPDLSLEQIAELVTAIDSAATVTSLMETGWTMDQWEGWVADFLNHFFDPTWLNEQGSAR